MYAGVRHTVSTLAQPKPSKHLSPIQEVESPRSYLLGAEGLNESADHWLWEPQPAPRTGADAELREGHKQPESGDESSWMVGSPAEPEQGHEDEPAESSWSLDSPLVAESPRNGEKRDFLEEPRMCHSPRLQERASDSSSRAGAVAGNIILLTGCNRISQPSWKMDKKEGEMTTWRSLRSCHSLAVSDKMRLAHGVCYDIQGKKATDRS